MVDHEERRDTHPECLGFDVAIEVVCARRSRGHVDDHEMRRRPSTGVVRVGAVRKERRERDARTAWLDQPELQRFVEGNHRVAATQEPRVTVDDRGAERVAALGGHGLCGCTPADGEQRERNRHPQ